MNKPVSELIALADSHATREEVLALAINNELCRQIDASEKMDTLRVTSKIVALPIVQGLLAASRSGSERAGVDARPRPSDCACPMQCGWHHVRTDPEINMWLCSQPDCNHMVRAQTALHSPKIAAAETGPGDAGRTAPITCPNCHDESDCSNVDICNAVEAAYSSDVKAEAKSQEPEAVAIKPLEWYEEPLRNHENPAWNATTDFGSNYRVFKAWRGKEKKAGWIGNGEFHNTEAEAKAAAQADYEQRIRSALIHPTTKPEARAVSVDAIKAALRPFIGHDKLGVKVQDAARVVAALIAEGR